MSFPYRILSTLDGWEMVNPHNSSYYLRTTKPLRLKGTSPSHSQISHRLWLGKHKTTALPWLNNTSWIQTQHPRSTPRLWDSSQNFLAPPTGKSFLFCYLPGSYLMWALGVLSLHRTTQLSKPISCLELRLGTWAFKNSFMVSLVVLYNSLTNIVGSVYLLPAITLSKEPHSVFSLRDDSFFFFF